jgi:DNA-binding winged helix-turn-helix (wHTH) protein/TolB-like protein/Tfp pilus assembly protein PilF
MTKISKHFYEFGPFRLDPVERQLRREYEVVQLTPKAFEVLLLLVRNSRHVLKKEEVLAEVWKDSFVEEKNLTDNISILRKALGDDPKKPTYIETVTRHGYRFLANVHEVHENGEELLVAESVRASVVIEEDDTPALANIITPRALSAPKSRTLLVLFAAIAMITIALVIYYFVSRREVPTQQLRSLAVLPLKPLGSVSSDDLYLGPGLADALINRLSTVRQITVRPTSAVLKYSGPQSDLTAIAREQQVDAVLDGSFQRAGERVRVTVQLVRAHDGAPLWAGTFDEKFTDIFAMQDSISQKVANALVPKLSKEETASLTRRETENSEAYRLYLIGHHFWNKRTAEGFTSAINYYQQAIAIDPNYALAHAGLAETYVLLPNWTGSDPNESFQKAERAARRALELNPNLAEGYAALGAVKVYLHRDSAGAGEDYRRATELNPSYATAHHWFGEWLTMRGRLNEGVKELESAHRLDPLSTVISFAYTVMLYYSRRLDEAEVQARKTLELDPGFFRAHIFLSRIYLDKGQYDRSLQERAQLLGHGDANKTARLENIFSAALRAGGREGLLQKQLEISKQLGSSADPNDRRYFHPNVGIGGWVEFCAALGDKECTFAGLQAAEQARHPILDYLKVDPYFDFIRNDPRYTELLGRLNLPL